MRHQFEDTSMSKKKRNQKKKEKKPQLHCGQAEINGYMYLQCSVTALSAESSEEPTLVYLMYKFILFFEIKIILFITVGLFLFCNRWPASPENDG